MNSKNTIQTFIVAAASLCLFSCSSTYHEVYPTLMDGKYDSEFPYKNCSDQLEDITETIKRVNCIAYYRSYIFSMQAKVTHARLMEPYIIDQASEVVYLNRTASGTAVLVEYENKHLCMLTCAHIVDFPDTVISYYNDENQKRTPYIRTLSIKDRQSNYTVGLPNVSDMEILAINTQRDLAVLGAKLSAEAPPQIAVFTYPLGSAKELEWGSFVYLFGYPSGQCMVTKAIVSQPNKDRSGSFLTDAVFNKGFSGGIVLAVRDGVPNFELVGIAQQVPGHIDYHVTPTNSDGIVDYDPEIPYKGDLYVERRSEIDYGVAQIISIESVIEFLLENRSALAEKGYDIGRFISHRSLVHETQQEDVKKAR